MHVLQSGAFGNLEGGGGARVRVDGVGEAARGGTYSLVSVTKSTGLVLMFRSEDFGGIGGGEGEREEMNRCSGVLGRSEHSMPRASLDEDIDTLRSLIAPIGSAPAKRRARRVLNCETGGSRLPFGCRVKWYLSPKGLYSGCDEAPDMRSGVVILRSLVDRSVWRLFVSSGRGGG